MQNMRATHNNRISHFLPALAEADVGARPPRKLSKSDEQLFKDFRSGDQSAISELERRFERPLRALIRCRLANSEAVDDVAQETWIKVIRNASRFDGDKKFSSWLFSIAANAAVDCNRRESRHLNVLSLDMRGSQAQGGEGEGSFAALIPASTADPAEIAMIREARQAVRVSFSALGPLQQRYLRGRFVDQIPFRDLDPSALASGTVKSRYNNSLRRMREEFIDRSFPDKSISQIADIISRHGQTVEPQILRASYLRFVEKRPWESIAEQLHIGEKRAKSLARKGREIMQLDSD
ncbi:MAG: sigma-70 family RNA polymerase sigma factor [Deltaproteobacteria bacterium]|nr:sigma-70 family RNA polymerase sigma factor [Deltaproteobacteria bacterium]